MIIVRDKFFTPTTADCYAYLGQMKLPVDVVENIEAAIHQQSECELWFALWNVESQAPDLVKFCIEGHLLILKD